MKLAVTLSNNNYLGTTILASEKDNKFNPTSSTLSSMFATDNPATNTKFYSESVVTNTEELLSTTEDLQANTVRHFEVKTPDDKIVFDMDLVIETQSTEFVATKASMEVTEVIRYLSTDSFTQKLSTTEPCEECINCQYWDKLLKTQNVPCSSTHEKEAPISGNILHA